MKLKKRWFAACLSLFLVVTFCFSSQVQVEAKRKPIVYLMGDSTVSSRDNTFVNGWGQHLYKYFGGPKANIKTLKILSKYDYATRYTNYYSNIIIENWAKSGSSVKSFSSQRLFNTVCSKIKKGDYVIIQFGHNEINKECQGSSISNYKKYLTSYVNKIRKKKAKVIFVTSPPVYNFKKGKCQIYVQKYRTAMISVGKKKKVPVLDVGKKCADYFTKIGSKKTKEMYIHDNMHFTPLGAQTLARIISVEMKYQKKIKPLAKYISLNTNTLYRTINKVCTLNSKKYTKKTWKNLNKTCVEAKKTLYNINAKQKDLEKANSTVKKAIKGLRKVKKHK